MLDHEATVALAKRMLALDEAHTTEQAAEQFRVPVWKYIDEDRWRLEMDRIFKRVPLPLALSCELPAPHSYKALFAVDLPVLIVRDGEGVARAFMNVCRHRGAVVVPESCGEARRFTCPYHGWVYDQRGGLAGIYGDDTFGPLERDTMGLTPLPCEERSGLVFVTLTSGDGMDVDEWLGDYQAELDTLELATWHVFDRRQLASPAWKVAYDGYLEGYHFSNLHRDTIFKDTKSNLMAFDMYGPHQRVTFAKQSLSELRDMPETEWKPVRHIGPVHTLFPCLSIAGGWNDFAMVSLLMPGPTADRSTTRQTFITRHPVETDEQRRRAEISTDFLYTVVRDEDYTMGAGITSALRSGANEEFVFGRNELSLHHFHQWVDRLVQ